MSDLLEQYKKMKLNLNDAHTRGHFFHSFFNDILEKYKMSTVEERAMLREKISEDIEAKLIFEEFGSNVSKDLIHLCSLIEIPEAKDKLMGIFCELKKIYDKGSDNAFLYNDLLLSLSKIRTMEIRELLESLKNEKDIENPYYKMICDTARNCLKLYKGEKGSKGT